MYEITDDFDALLRRAPETAAYYFRKAVTCIDETFSEGYTQAHPELIIGFMQICQQDFANAAKSVRRLAALELRQRELDLRERELEIRERELEDE